MRLFLLLAPFVVFAGPPRFARLGEIEGRVEVRLAPADAWQEGVRNLPLPEAALVQTAAGSRAEIELDDGSVLRLGQESLAEISDLTALSTGQRITTVSLDRGLAYFTGEAAVPDSFILNLPGSQVVVRQKVRVRLEAREVWSQFAVMVGGVRFSSPTAELDIRENQTVRVEPANAARFFLYREVTALDSDRWSEERDKALAAPSSAAHVGALRSGVADLDAAGVWLSTDDYGTVWLPKAAEGWAPYRNGRWLWYDAIGYTWIGGDAWGWLPYHYGRWVLLDKGWAWAPASGAFLPGSVYWLRGAKIAGWGPLAPGETYDPATIPRQFLNVHTTWAAWQPDTRRVDPAGFEARPKEPLEVATFVSALPSPPMAAARLEAKRTELRAGRARVTPLLPGTSYDAVAAEAAGARSAPPPPSPPPPPPSRRAASAPAPIVVVMPKPEPVEVFYPAPIYTGIIVMNPPERKSDRERRRRGQQPPPPAATATPTPAPPNEPPKPAKPETPPEEKPKEPAPPEENPPASKPGDRNSSRPSVP